ncbi:MAG: DUF3943 domain-containing protein [Treponema sp.]|nr:DUF3943 domain-containing protein [Treponema sp.]
MELRSELFLAGALAFAVPASGPTATSAATAAATAATTATAPTTSAAAAAASSPPAQAAQSAAPARNAAPESRKPPRYALALAEIAGNNVAMNLFDRFVDEPLFPMKDDERWADSDLSTSLANLAGPWGFDEDPWLVNEVGHPIQGSFYFTAGRSNGLGFWGSAAGTALGSFMWKIFGEVDDSNINDLVTTTMGGMALGEMEHRLYLAAKRSGYPARFAASPLDAANDALFGPMDRDEELSYPRELSLSVQAGFLAPFAEPSPAGGAGPGFGGFTGELGDTLRYGDPFEADSAPYDYFEQRLDLAVSPSFWGLAFFSDGTLFTLPLADTGRDELALASCLHYDFIYSSLVELEANAVGLSLIGRHAAPDGFVLSGELHLDAVVLGTDENTYLRELNGVQTTDEEGRDYDWGFGEGLKLYLAATRQGFGTLRLEYAAYGMNPVPGTATAQAPLEYAIVGLLSLSYDHPIAADLSLGAAYTLYHKNAFYASWPEVAEYAQALSVYVRLALI